MGRRRWGEEAGDGDGERERERERCGEGEWDGEGERERHHPDASLAHHGASEGQDAVGDVFELNGHLPRC